MACAEEIYRAALEELANEGSEKARFALTLGDKLPKPVSRELIRANVSEHLAQASRSLNNALNENDSQWTKSTDRCIHTAQTRIVEALRLL